MFNNTLAKIAVASGKGGTGKTTVATNLAVTLASYGKQSSEYALQRVLTMSPTLQNIRAEASTQSSRFQANQIAYLDCDVEAPNGHIFLKPIIQQRKAASIPVPNVNLDVCDGCGECGKVCQFSAIVAVKGTVLTFPELCHGCGGCSLACPIDAITEKDREIGTVEIGVAGSIKFVAGRLNIGEAMSPPLIRSVKNEMPKNGVVIIDSPPGTSCPMIEAIQGSDYVLLVTEPTPFGLSDLKLAVDTIRELSIPFGVIINRWGLGDDRVEEYCQRENITVLVQIPDDRDIAVMYSKGELLVDVSGAMRKIYNNLIIRLDNELLSTHSISNKIS
ncbi:MAG: P-loop NTPase [Candidatus Hatepunaea meridiana]|nr:P-loop NTPase [Candidatus Hatepunaea meridiana]